VKETKAGTLKPIKGAKPETADKSGEKGRSKSTAPQEKKKRINLPLLFLQRMLIPKSKEKKMIKARPLIMKKMIKKRKLKIKKMM